MNLHEFNCLLCLNYLMAQNESVYHFDKAHLGNSVCVVLDICVAYAGQAVCMN